MYKDDFLAIGGHDELFAPQSREDSDILVESVRIYVIKPVFTPPLPIATPSYRV